MKHEQIFLELFMCFENIEMKVIFTFFVPISEIYQLLVFGRNEWMNEEAMLLSSQ